MKAGDPRLSRDRSGADAAAMLAAIIASSDDAIVSKNLDGVIQSWNAATERIFGYSEEEMIGQSITRMIPPERSDEEPRILERLKRGERVDHFETVRVHKSGARVEVSVTISPIRDATGRVIGASKIARDISERRRIEQERERLLQRERAARAEAERLSRLKDEFLATVSHELRTPLNAIYGWSQLLARQEVGSAEVQEGLEVIARNARVQTQLVEDLLDMSRIVSGKLRLDVQPVDLGEVLEAAIQSVLPAAEARGIRLLKVIGSNSLVSGDASRLQQVAWNLLTNALKFTPKGGEVQVVLERVQSHIELRVSDTGEGIAADFLPHLFERFQQADATTTRRHGGLGLGLAIVRHFVEMHGGTVRVQSPGKGKGSTFTIELPVRAAHIGEQGTSPRQPEQLTAPPAHGANLAGLRLLLVDDDADARRLIRRILEDAGAEVAVCESAAQGLANLRQDRPDLLICDIGMPSEDGYSFLRRIRALPAEEGGQTSAVALTAFARPEDRTKALLAGFQMHVRKPVEPEELVAAVATLSRRV
jgi:PAS domain S-box-containing protein